MDPGTGAHSRYGERRILHQKPSRELCFEYETSWYEMTLTSWTPLKSLILEILKYVLIVVTNVQKMATFAFKTVHFSLHKVINQSYSTIWHNSMSHLQALQCNLVHLWCPNGFTETVHYNWSISDQSLFKTWAEIRNSYIQYVKHTHELTDTFVAVIARENGKHFATIPCNMYIYIRQAIFVGCLCTQRYRCNVRVKPNECQMWC